MALVRKRLICKCGCRGTHTWDAVSEALVWSFRCLASKKHPGSRHDNKPWHHKDLGRSRMAGLPGGIRAAVVQLKGDWAELCARLGYPTWSSNLRPCFLCNCPKADLGQVAGCSLLAFPHRTNTPDDYKTAIDRCRVDVTLTAAQHRALRLALRFDKRRNGARGLALENLTGLEAVEPKLAIGDRLEANDQLLDIGDIWSVREFPVRLRFWRRSEESLCLSVCPLFDYDIGLCPTTVICADILHTYHLGVGLQFARFAMWKLLVAGVWGDVSSSVAQRSIAVTRLRSALWEWYRERAELHPGENLTRLADLTPGMLGTEAKPDLKTKAAETWGIMLFLNDKVQANAGALGADARPLLDCGSMLVQVYEIMKANGNIVPEAAQQDCFA